MDFDVLDNDEQAFVKKPKPVGWFAAGLVLIVALTLFAAYYMPLSSAHDKLATEHEALAKKAAELDHWLKTDREKLAKSEARRAALQKFVDTALAVDKERKGRLEIVQATIERELAAFLKSKLMTLEADTDGITLSFKERAMFRRRSGATGPSARRTLCKAVGSLSGAKDFTVHAIARSYEGDNKYWETATERAANVAQILDGSCSFSSQRIEAGAEQPGKKAEDADAALVLHLRLERDKPFSPQDAPQVTADVAAK